jgi:hypothetical protein
MEKLVKISFFIRKEVSKEEAEEIAISVFWHNQCLRHIKNNMSQNTQ